eukprot:3907235-Prymnesium_polylepis.1
MWRPCVLLSLLALPGCVTLDYYRELGITRRASVSDIKAAYRELAKKYHPDKNKEPSAQSKFQRVALAYETLSDPDKRRQYDMHGEDYASHERQHQHRQHRQHDFFDPFNQYRRRPQVRGLCPSSLARARAFRACVRARARARVSASHSRDGQSRVAWLVPRC